MTLVEPERSVCRSLRPRRKEVFGVELNRDAVKDAVINAKRNNIKNEQLYNADAGKFMVELSEQNKKVDVVFMDPPRAGSDEAFLSSVVKLDRNESGLRVMQSGDTCERFKISHKTWVSGCRVPALRHVSVHETCGGNSCTTSDRHVRCRQYGLFLSRSCIIKKRNYSEYSDGMQKRRKYGALVLRDIAVEIQYVPETWCDDAGGKTTSV